MEQIKSSLTITFEDPFWVGIYQRSCGGRTEAARVVFGPEPRDCEVYEYFLKNWSGLRFSPPVQGGCPAQRKLNPKRVQRQVHRQLCESGAGTKAQQALQLLREQLAAERKTVQRERREQRKREQFALRQNKKKEKHRGR